MVIFDSITYPKTKVDHLKWITLCTKEPNKKQVKYMYSQRNESVWIVNQFQTQNVKWWVACPPKALLCDSREVQPRKALLCGLWVAWPPKVLRYVPQQSDKYAVRKGFTNPNHEKIPLGGLSFRQQSAHSNSVVNISYQDLAAEGSMQKYNQKYIFFFNLSHLLKVW